MHIEFDAVIFTRRQRITLYVDNRKSLIVASNQSLKVSIYQRASKSYKLSCILRLSFINKLTLGGFELR